MFSLLHTNDLHSAIGPSHVSRLKALKETFKRETFKSGEGYTGLLIDAGDAVASGNVTYRADGEQILLDMNAAGYDLMTVGNREFHLTKRGFFAKLKLARFPVLCSNVVLKGEHIEGGSQRSRVWKGYDVATASNPDPDYPVCDYVVRTLSDPLRPEKTLTIAFFGITVPMITASMWERHLSNYLFVDPIETAKQIVPFLREDLNPDLIVAVTHIGITADRRLASAVAGIDLIVGGHSHTVLEAGEMVGDTLLVQAGSHGRFVGKVDIDPCNGKRPSLIASLIPLTSESTKI